MGDKKISFGFSKLKKPALLPGVSAAKKPEVQMIQCLEGQTIKIIGQTAEEVKPLVIPLIGNTKTSAALAALQTIKNTIEGTEAEASVASTTSAAVSTSASATLDQKAAAEILSSLQEAQSLEASAGLSKLVLPLTADDLPLDGAREPTLDNYEQVPIGHFGLAMLRGMGWKDEDKKADGVAGKGGLDGPMLRPKGMGLGADKMIKAKPLLVQPAKGEVLELRRGASVRILSGKRKDAYGQGTTPRSVVLIDWQVSAIVSPAMDLIPFLLCNTEKPLRDQHYHRLLGVYHAELSAVIRQLGSDPDALFSCADLLDQLAEFGCDALVMAPLGVSIMVTPPEEMRAMADLTVTEDAVGDGNALAVLSARTELLYKQRLQDILQDARRLGYLDRFERGELLVQDGGGDV